MKCTAVAFLIVATSALVSSQFECPKKNGVFQDRLQCDRYFECVNGVARPKLCDDGLVFNVGRRSANRCESVLNVDCTGRELMQTPRPVGDCRRRNGVFEHPDESVCHVMVSCTGGEAEYVTCPADLIFDKTTGTCTWPYNTDREGCVPRQEIFEDGFQCPESRQLFADGYPVGHGRYPHPTDCQRFYVCLDGTTPRLHSCPAGNHFNPETRLCENPDNFDSVCNSEVIENDEE